MNEPAAIVKAMLARDLQRLGRYTGWNEIEYLPLGESFPPYIVTKVKGSDGKEHESEEVPTLGRCAQRMVVKNAKVSRVENAPDPTSPVNESKGLRNEMLVIVQAEVLALRLDHQDAIPENERCSWLGLRVKNTQTGKNEVYFDNVDNDRALLKMMKQFGKANGEYVVVDPHRRQWEYAVSMRLPLTGKGELRHYFVSRELGGNKFVDATEPRWLIQEPYPPEAWHIDTAIAFVQELIDRGVSDARSSCHFALVKAFGISLINARKIKAEMNMPICRDSKEVQKDISFTNSRRNELEILRQIKMEMNHE